MNLFKGLCKVLNIWGANFKKKDTSTKSMKVTEADARAISSDWEAVGKDLKNAMGHFDER